MSNERHRSRKAYKMMKEQDKINFGKYHKTLLHIHTLSSYDFKLYDEWNKQYFYLLAKMKYLELLKRKYSLQWVF